MPTVSFLRVRPDRKASDFHKWLLDQVATAFDIMPSSDAHAVDSIGEPAPTDFVLPAAMQLTASNSTPWPPYDAAVLCTGAERAQLVPASVSEWVDLDHVYRVTPKVIKDYGTIIAGSPTTGIKYLRGLIFHQDLPETAIRRAWANHAPLAVEVHEGASRYVQWWVDENLSPDSPQDRRHRLSAFRQQRCARQALLRFPSRPEGDRPGYGALHRGRTAPVVCQRLFVSGTKRLRKDRSRCPANASRC